MPEFLKDVQDERDELRAKLVEVEKEFEVVCGDRNCLVDECDLHANINGVLRAEHDELRGRMSVSIADAIETNKEQSAEITELKAANKDLLGKLGVLLQDGRQLLDAIAGSTWNAEENIPVVHALREFDHEITMIEDE